MKTLPVSMATGLLLFLTTATPGQLDIPSDGSDGVFTGGTVDLGLALEGNWDDPVPEEHMGKGVYDPNVWAVVFKYESIATVRDTTFINHPSGAPVVWLVAGDANIGRVSLDADELKPGPGGFYGGRKGPGLGPGAGGTIGESGSYGSIGHGTAEDRTYGNSQIMPLVGGSGSAINYHYSDLVAGRGGGGAILIAASGTVSINGTVSSNGGRAPRYTNGTYGSGGAIRILCDQLYGDGTLQAHGSDGILGVGRIRVESNLVVFEDPGTPLFSFAAPDNPPKIFPDETFPVIRSIRIGGRDVPADPIPLGFTPAMTFDSAGDYELEIEAMMVPSDATVNVRVTPDRGSEINTTAEFVSGNLGSSLWKSTVTLSEGRAHVQARVTLDEPAP